MTDDLLQSLGPPPFRFTPTRPGQASAAYTLPFKLLSTLMVLAGSLWLGRLWQEGVLGSGGSSGLAWLLCGLVLMLYTGRHFLTSRNRLDETALHQSWIWDKHLELRELAYGKLIRVPGLEWLIAPRLYVRTLMGKFAVFYASDAALLADFERLVKELAEFRRMD